MNRIRIMMLLICGLISTNLLGQKDTVFYENFKNNDNHWTLKDTTFYTTKIENNQFVFTYRGENNYSFWNWIEIDYKKNFQIEMKTKWIDGNSNNGYGITLGFKDWDNYLEFNISANGFYFVRYRYQGVDIGNGWKQSGFINDSAENKLKIVKYDNILAFYVNGYLLEKIPYEKIIVRNFGLMLYNRQTVAFGEILVKYLNQNDINGIFGNTEAERLKGIENEDKKIKNRADSNYWTVNRKRIIFDEKFDNNDHLWFEQNLKDTVVRKITGGAYSFENFVDTRMITFQTIHLLKNYNYTISCKIKWISGKSDFGYGLMWSSKDMKNNNEFIIAADGAYRISAYNKDNSEPAQWVKDSTMNIKGENILTIDRRKDSLYLFINNKKVATFEDMLMSGNDIGFIVDNKQKVIFDDFLVTAELPEYKNLAKQVILSDNFKDGACDWETGKNENSTASVSKGNYIIEHYDTSYGHARAKEIFISDGSDFLIQTRVKYITKAKDQSYGLIFGHRDWGNNYQFLINSSGLFKCIHSVNGKAVATGWKNCESFKPDDYNEIEIYKKGDRVEYSVNGRMLEVMPFYRMFGYILGFVIYGKQTIAVENITVTAEFPECPEVDKEKIVKEVRFFKDGRSEWDFKGKKDDGSFVERSVHKGYLIIDLKGKNKDDIYKDQIVIPKGLPDVKESKDRKGFVAEKDFKLEFVLQFIKSDTNTWAGITFEDKSFFIRMDGKYNVNNKGWVGSNVISQTSIIKLSVEKHNNKMYFLLNGFVIETSPAVFKKSEFEPGLNVNFELVTKGNIEQTIVLKEFFIKHY